MGSKSNHKKSKNLDSGTVTLYSTIDSAISLKRKSPSYKIGTGPKFDKELPPSR